MVKRDNERRSAVCAKSASAPIASITGFDSKSSLAQALPVLAPMPFLLRSHNIASPSIPFTLTKIVLGTRSSFVPTTNVSGICKIASSSLSRSLRIVLFSKSRCATASSMAFPIPTMPGTLSVPLRRPPICSPPCIKLVSCCPARIYSPPTPFGP